MSIRASVLRWNGTRPPDRCDAGEIRESGTHAQLLAQNGRYAALYAIQSAAGGEEAIHADA